jgi:23S rRNA pseudouridine1911/1915/1917 synthase
MTEASADSSDRDAPIEFSVTSDEAGERIDRVLAARPLGYSRSQLQSWIGEGRVELDGEPTRPKQRVVEGALVHVWPAPPPESEARPQDLPLTVLFEDGHLLVLDKAAGMVVHPAPGHPDGTLVNALLHHAKHTSAERSGAAVKMPGDVGRPGIVHRLDKDTSGVMVVAKTTAAREGLLVQFAAHTIEREYLALVLGHPPDFVRHDTLHGRHPIDRKRFSSRVERGRRAVTEVRVLERLHGASLVGCRLHTGRTHQIRVHLSDAGHPVLADPLYGRRSHDARVEAAAQAIGRQALHARLLGFTHPVTEQPLRFETEPDPAFGRALALLRQT